LLEPLNRCHCN